MNAGGPVSAGWVARDPESKRDGMKARQKCGFLLAGGIAWFFLLTALGWAQFDPNSSVQPLRQATWDSSWVPVTFRFYHPLAGGDSAVALLGSFNAWGNTNVSQDARYDLMSDPDGDGWWTVTLDLPQGTHEYKFVSLNSTHPRPDDGYAHVTNWFSDPLNPEYGGPYQNSILHVSDPMLYYVLPSERARLNEERPRLAFNASASYRTGLQPEKVVAALDDGQVSLDSLHFDPDWRAWTTRPRVVLAPGEHVWSVEVYNRAGQSARATHRFRVTHEITTALYRFVIDTRSPNFQYVGRAQSVSVLLEPRGTVPRTVQLNPTSVAGVFVGEVALPVRKPVDYRVVVDRSTYTIDWDNPVLSLEHKSVAQKQVTSTPRIRVDPDAGLPLDGAVLTAADFPLELVLVIDPSDSGYAVDSLSVQADVDGVPLMPWFERPGKGLRLGVRLTGLSLGRHRVRVTAADIRGNPAEPFVYTLAVVDSGPDVWGIDAEGDATGPGTYRLPTNVADGAVDLLSAHFWGDEQGDTTWLAVDLALKALDPRTRVLLTVWSDAPAEFEDALSGLELMLPRWQGRGFQLILADPRSSAQSPDLNRVVFAREPSLDLGPVVTLADSALDQAHFVFRLPLAALAQHVGPTTEPWHWSVVAFLADANGEPLEVDAGLGGQAMLEDPDVYDVLFCLNTGFQRRLLRNTIVSWGIGGPRLAHLGTDGRGALSFRPADLVGGTASPEVTLNTRGSRWVESTVTLHGRARATEGTSVAVTGPAGTVSTTVAADSSFALRIPLVPGENRLVARLENGTTEFSEPAIFRRVTRSLPRVLWTASVDSQGFVRLDASASSDPAGRPLRFRWQQDPQNPEPVDWTGAQTQLVRFRPPTVPGEYYFDLEVVAEADTARARAVLVVRADGKAVAPDLGVWHPAWVDSLVLYEIYPRSFSLAGKLRAITGRMEELADLGVTGLWLMPIHPSAMTHGYWITNYFAVNPEYGTLRDLRQLVRVAHEHGIRVILDFVVQHTHFSHPFMRDAFAFGPASPYYRFYLWRPNGDYVYLFDWRNLPSVNFADSLAPNFFVQVARFWVEKCNVDGFRCDVAWAVDNLRKGGPEFWQRLRRELKMLKPDVFLLAEAPTTESNHFDRKFDAAYDGWFLAKIQNLLGGSGTVRDLDEDVRYHLSDRFPKHALPMRYLENHDTGRFVSLYGVKATRLAAVLLFTLPGIPLVEYGQEVGERSHRGVVQWTDPYRLRPFYRKLIHLRRRLVALRGRNLKTLHAPASIGSYAYWRWDDRSGVLVVANFGQQADTLTLRVPPALVASPFRKQDVLYLNNILDSTWIRVSGRAAGDTLVVTVRTEGVSAGLWTLSKTPIGTAVSEKPVSIPKAFRLWPAYPNPFNPSTVVRYRLGGCKNVRVTLRVYDVLGRCVRTLVNAPRRPGTYTVRWDGRNDRGELLASGVYLVELRAGHFRSVRRMVLLK